MEDIKACPFCGGDAYLNSNFTYKHKTYFVFVKCDICGAQGKIFSCNENPASEKVNWENAACNKAVRLWNMRQEREEGIG